MDTYTGAFTPTFLYIKRHTVTGLLYFGKTTKRDPVKYRGSGSRWVRHIKKHGIDQIETLWYCLFMDRNELIDFAIMFSSMHNIDKSPDWANLMYENGIDGNAPGCTLSEEHRKNIGKGSFGKRDSEATRANKSKAQKGRIITEEHKAKMREAWKRRKNRIGHSQPHSEETKRKISESMRRVK